MEVAHLLIAPGWHLGEIPYALQFNRGAKIDNPPGITNKKCEIIKVGEFFPGYFVWAEVEYANDVGYQNETMRYGYNEAGNFQHSLAGLPRIPKDGSYKYRTNANPATAPWIITGAMKVNKILKPSEVDALVRKVGREPQKREAGAVTDEQIEQLNKDLFVNGGEKEFSIGEKPGIVEDIVSDRIVDGFENLSYQELRRAESAVLENGKKTKIMSAEVSLRKILTIFTQKMGSMILSSMHKSP